MTATAATRAVLLSYTLLVLTPRQALPHNIQRISPKTSPTYEELASSLFVNQMAILELMHNSPNATCVTANMRNESNVDREATRRLEETLGTRMDRVLAALEVQQQHTQQMLDTLNITAMDTLTKVEEVREEMKEELVKIAEDMQVSATQTRTTEQVEEEEAIAVPEITYSGVIVHNDSLPSLCNGDKILFGSVGSLTVVASGSYPSGVLCSWNLTFPAESSVTLTWEYIDMENHPSCNYDWVDVRHNSHSVYGRKLCGSLNSSIRQLLDLTLHKINNLLVSFRSDGSNEKSGFRLLYHAH
ncbi:uncharacterized protein LOC123499702 [Portunus trituberculatus]|uniref:uncharacterized protein LOC123499702 n=1 Tax=Portunus trituberculatus TaxID=210409 RepID=UPI001E1CB715|nr:uncharacterized protein LOC123499702 [Portunus trituberculatus]